MKLLFVCIVLIVFSGEFGFIGSRPTYRFNKLLHLVARSCDVLSEAHHGCKIENSQCICSFGCKSEFRYTTKRECTDALKVIDET